MSTSANSREIRRLTRTVNREWEFISANDAIGEDEAKALYWKFICSDSDEDVQNECAVGHIHEWIDDIEDCATADATDCTITVPTGRDEFISDLAIAGAWSHMDADDDGSLDQDEMDWFSYRLAVSPWSAWAPSDLMTSCDVDDSTDPLVTDFSGDLDKDELHDCWAANVPDCLSSDFDTAFGTIWTDHLGLADDATLDAAAVTALEGVIAELSDWHTDSTSGHNHEACPAPVTRRLASFFTSFFN